MDTLSKEQRSLNMSKIHSFDTKPEILVRRYLFANGFRYRVNVKSLPGTPDIVLRKYRTVIFIHGCFWHQHECMKGKLPKTNTEFWEQKFRKNHERDISVREKLKQLGWNTLIVWECQLKPTVREQTLKEIAYLLNKSQLKILHHRYQIYEEPIRIAAEEPAKYGLD